MAIPTQINDKNGGRKNELDEVQELLDEPNPKRTEEQMNRRTDERNRRSEELMNNRSWQAYKP